MAKKDYCTQNDGDCETCSLVNYGRDCRNVSLAAATLGKKGGSAKSPAKRAAGVENMAKARAARKQVGWPKGKLRKKMRSDR